MTRLDPAIARAAGALACALLLLGSSACAIDLKSLAPFPCGADGTCPEGFLCDTENGGKCVLADSSCSNDSDCKSMGAYYCGSSTCKACNTVTRCGSSCEPCTEALPVCGPSECVQCVGDGDCLGDGAHCSSNACQCSSGTLCGNTCTDLLTSTDDCGTCGHACAAGVSCTGGACSGSCTPACRTDQVCLNAACTCAPGVMFCGASCGQCPSDQIATCLSDGTHHCCAKATPVYCEQDPGVCWGTDVNCDSFVECSDDSWHSCPDSLNQFYNCTNRQCEDCSAACLGQACGGAGCFNCGQCAAGKVCVSTGKCI